MSKDDFTEIGAKLPAPPIIESNRFQIRSFMENSNNIVQLVLHVLSKRLGLPENTLPSIHTFDSPSGDQVRFLRAIPQPPEDRRVAFGGHSDFGSVTVLFNRLGGLQILLPENIKPIPPTSTPTPAKDAEGTSSPVSAIIGTENTGEEWAYVRPLPGHAVINLGDALVKFSAGILRSNIHRVVAPPGAQGDLTRYALAYFNRPGDDVLLKALEGSEAIERALEKQGGREAWDGEAMNSKDWIVKRALGRRKAAEYGSSLGTDEERIRNREGV